MIEILVFLLAFLCVRIESASIEYLPKTGTPPPPHESAGAAYDSVSNKLYLYGGMSEFKCADMWEFDMNTYKWKEIHSPSSFSPGARSRPFLTVLEDSRKLLLFGGNTDAGPVSDLWVYELASENVSFIQWRIVDYKGKAPPRAYYRSVCDYIHNGKRYIAVYGGMGKSEYITSLFILDIETFTWTELPSTGSIPRIMSQEMQYYHNSFYLFTGLFIYRYDLDAGNWVQHTLSGINVNEVSNNAVCIYKDNLYSILGWDNSQQRTINFIYKISLDGDKYETEQIAIDTELISAGYDCRDNLIYIYGGSSFKNNYNGLALLDLSQSKLSFSILSKDMSVPTPRRGHAMEVHEDTLYIFGGVDSSANMYFICSLLDMWAYNLNQDNWRPVLAQSYTVPSPRSEFAHAKYQEDFIIFGGKGESGLLGDLYSYSISANKWKLISPDSTPSPSPRRASCMAVADDYILIYGGIDASGYNNQLWKFEWATQSYTLLEASSPPPKSAFSQCQIYSNSLNQMVFQVAMGESDGENPIAFIYEYNLDSNQWLEIRPPSNNSSAARVKAAIFMIKEYLVVVGGTSYNNEAHEYIDVLHTVTGELSRIGTLPSNFYHGASAYYKNKIYIHGGSDSFGTLTLKKILKNDLLVINLNQNCELSPSMCIHACSKGTYNKDGDCYLCPKGSYSSSIGSDSCSLCPSGYFSDSIGAVTMRTCKPCPYGYFNTKEGQASCLICPAGSMCSFNQIKPEIPSEIPKYNSIQPDLLEYCTEHVEIISMYFNIVISVILVLVIIPLIAYPKPREFLKKLDMYSQHHNYEENRPMRIKKTLIGGIFTTAFIFGSLAIIFNMFLSFSLDNIRETKGLVPLLALQQQYESFPSQEAYFEFYLTDYGGECGTRDGECTKYLDLKLDKVYGTLEDLTCISNDLDCKISFKITDFDIKSLSSIDLKLTESQSFCSGIVVKIETSSSIPGEISSINNVIRSDKFHYFRGQTPTVFTYLMTPSLFTTDTNEWENEQTGYHVSILQETVRGSQATYTDMLFMNNLEVSLKLYQNGAVLHTQRLQIQSISSFLGNLAGSVIGVMGMFGFFMNQFEVRYEKYTKNRVNTIQFDKVKQSRFGIIYKNFETEEILKYIDTGQFDKPMNLQEPNTPYSPYSIRVEDPLKMRIEGLSPP